MYYVSRVGRKRERERESWQIGGYLNVRNGEGVGIRASQLAH
jgi:hypothetical protein